MLDEKAASYTVFCCFLLLPGCLTQVVNDNIPRCDEILGALHLLVSCIPASVVIFINGLVPKAFAKWLALNGYSLEAASFK